jgi:hypothetical protein
VVSRFKRAMSGWCRPIAARAVAKEDRACSRQVRGDR